MSTIALIAGKRDLRTFALVYSLGNAVNIAGTMFLAGPTKQCKKMFKATRWLVTTIFLLALAATIAVAFLLKGKKVQKPLILTLVLIQFCAYFWYCLTYIPFGRRLFKKACKTCFKDMTED